jgi:signal transduction histidine kinase
VNFRIQLAGTGHDLGRWLVLLFLALGVVAPAACVLWFMNEAMTNQRDAARQKLAEAYRGQLQLVRDRLDADLEKRAADLDREATSGTPPAVFERCIRNGLADTVVVLNPDGSVAYPSAAVALRADPLEARPDWMAARSLESQRFFSGAAVSYAAIAKADPDVSVAARAMQAHIRCLIRNGDKARAIRALETQFSSGRLLRGTDAGGRLIAADEQLLALSLIDPKDPLRLAAAERLHHLVADYQEPIPGPQRLFLMDELHSGFPTQAAERLAAQFLEAQRPRAASGVLEPGGLPDVWKLGSPGGRTVALLRTATVVAAMRKLIGSNQRVFDVAPPASKASDEWTSIGGRFPGWRITDPFVARDTSGGAAEPRVSRYVWIALAAIAVVALAAVAAGQALRRQWRLARLKTDLVAAVSHELKSPLASVRLLVETLLEDERPEGKTREYLEMIAHENLRLSRLIGNFLTFSRLERNLRKFDIRATAPERVVEAVVESAQERLHAPGCRFEVQVSPGLPAVRADEDALVTVLLNLLDNALKYTPGEKRIALRTLGRNGQVVFAVEDNGIGIAPREQKKIFRRFYQVDRRLARESGGCGLGLSIVDFIVRAHGGAVEVESQPGRGSTFSVILPSAGTARGAAA